MSNNINNQIQSTLDGVNKKLNELQQLTNQVQKSVTQAPSTSTQTPYPVNTTNPRWVEDVIAVPEYKNQLTQEFLGSEEAKALDKRMINLKEEIDLTFLEFCEKKTRFPSEKLDGYRAQLAKVKQSDAPTNYPVNQTVASEEEAKG